MDSPSSNVIIVLTALDVSVLPPLITSTANTDAEIGARFGVCFTFTGQSISSNLVLRANE